MTRPLITTDCANAITAGPWSTLDCQRTLGGCGWSHSFAPHRRIPLARVLSEIDKHLAATPPTKELSTR